jgi:DNA mismatch repair protein MutS2
VGTLVISGPNAGGKTVALKTVGLAVLMAAHGIPVPLAEGSTIPWFGHLWCHIGDEQDVAADLSTFSAAMTAAARMLRDAGADSLVLYDELGSGTDPLEGAALGCALLEELARRRATTIATTHLAAIALAAGEADGMDNAAMEYDEDRQRPTYTLRVGRPGRSRALEIAATTGVPGPILDRARELLGGQHLQLDRWLERLERLEGELLAERGDLARLRRAADDEQRRLASRAEELEAERRRVPEKLAEERERLRERAKRQLDDVLARLDEAVAERRQVGRRQREKLRQEALELPLDRPSGTPPEELREGAPVRLAGLGTVAVLEEVRGSRALVTSGGKRLWVPAGDLRPAAAEARPSSRIRVDVEEEGVGDELKLLGLDRVAARDELERFLDQALARGRARVRVVHGHGTGALRQVVQEVCREHPAVRSFRHPPQSRGGTGATEIELG